MEPYAQPIYTLDARGNLMLEVIREHFELSSTVMHKEIQGMHVITQAILHSKGIAYAELRPGLVPLTDRNEAAFIFDSQCIKSDWYGREVAKVLLPLLNKQSTQSVLCGDLIGRDQDFIYDILEESLVLSRPFTFVHGTALFCVYINNISKAALENLHADLGKSPAYVGYIPTTHASRAKTYLSTILVNSFLKHGSQIIMGHEDDRSNDENVNVVGYPFEAFGYRVVSMQSAYFGLFLSYKIERPVFPGFEVDTEMALNAVTPIVHSLNDFTVELEEAKHNYLRTQKLGKLESARIAEMSNRELAALIQAKITANYIYNLAYLPEHNVIKFNVILEIPRVGGYPTRLVAALEYQPEKKNLRVITLY